VVVAQKGGSGVEKQLQEMLKSPLEVTVKFWMLAGMAPDRKLSSARRVVRAVSRVMVEGMEPVKLLFCNCKFFKLVRRPMLPEMEPVRLL